MGGERREMGWLKWEGRGIEDEMGKEEGKKGG